MTLKHQSLGVWPLDKSPFPSLELCLFLTWKDWKRTANFPSPFQFWRPKTQWYQVNFNKVPKYRPCHKFCSSKACIFLHCCISRTWHITEIQRTAEKSESVSGSVLSGSFATPGTVAHQVPQSEVFSRQQHWSGLPFRSLGDLPDPGNKPGSPHCRHILYYRLSHQGSWWGEKYLSTNLSTFSSLVVAAAMNIHTSPKGYFLCLENFPQKSSRKTHPSWLPRGPISGAVTARSSSPSTDQLP